MGTKRCGVKNGKWCRGNRETGGWRQEEGAKEEGDEGAGTGCWMRIKRAG